MITTIWPLSANLSRRKDESSTPRDAQAQGKPETSSSCSDQNNHVSVSCERVLIESSNPKAGGAFVSQRLAQ